MLINVVAFRKIESELNRLRRVKTKTCQKELVNLLDRGNAVCVKSHVRCESGKSGEIFKGLPIDIIL